MRFLDRRLESALERALDDVPAVVLLGPRQVGKTTLALAVSERRDSVYLDLESTSDRARLSDAVTYLREHSDQLVVLDEVQRMPGLFADLRGLIDERRRSGRRGGQFLLLGSASIDLLRQSSESLAGRTRHLELTTLTADEVDSVDSSTWWLRGGFPDSFLAVDDGASLRWRRDFIRTYLERDIPQLGPRIPAERLRRLWTMLAHRQGANLNSSELARSLGVDAKTVASYVDLLVDLLLLRRLEPWHRNSGKRLVKAPEIFIRDSGIVHALLGIESRDDLLGHPVAGASWEGAAIESILAACPDGSGASFYRTSSGAELDLVLELPGEPGPWAIEIKRSTSPSVGKGFHIAADDVSASRKLVIHGGDDDFPLGAETRARSLQSLCVELRDRDRSDR